MPARRRATRDVSGSAQTAGLDRDDAPLPLLAEPDRRPPDNTGHLQVDFPHWLNSLSNCRPRRGAIRTMFCIIPTNPPIPSTRYVGTKQEHPRGAIVRKSAGRGRASGFMFTSCGACPRRCASIRCRRRADATPVGKTQSRRLKSVAAADRIGQVDGCPAHSVGRAMRRELILLAVLSAIAGCSRISPSISAWS